VTIESIMNDLQTKTKHHNERANAKLPPWWRFDGM
jgi:hypothetical protein